MVATLTTHDTIAQPNAVHTPDSAGEEQFELSELTRRPASWRGVNAHASDWISCLERRRGGMYLPI
jgi:hypothetical protein